MRRGVRFAQRWWGSVGWFIHPAGYGWSRNGEFPAEYFPHHSTPLPSYVGRQKIAFTPSRHPNCMKDQKDSDISIKRNDNGTQLDSRPYIKFFSFEVNVRIFFTFRHGLGREIEEYCHFSITVMQSCTNLTHNKFRLVTVSY